MPFIGDGLLQNSEGLPIATKEIEYNPLTMAGSLSEEELVEDELLSVGQSEAFQPPASSNVCDLDNISDLFVSCAPKCLPPEQLEIFLLATAVLFGEFNVDRWKLILMDQSDTASAATGRNSEGPGMRGIIAKMEKIYEFRKDHPSFPQLKLPRKDSGTKTLQKYLQMDHKDTKQAQAFSHLFSAFLIKLYYARQGYHVAVEDMRSTLGDIIYQRGMKAINSNRIFRYRLVLKISEELSMYKYAIPDSDPNSLQLHIISSGKEGPNSQMNRFLKDVENEPQVNPVTVEGGPNESFMTYEERIRTRQNRKDELNRDIEILQMEISKKSDEIKDLDDQIASLGNINKKKQNNATIIRKLRSAIEIDDEDEFAEITEGVMNGVALLLSKMKETGLDIHNKDNILSYFASVSDSKEDSRTVRLPEEPDRYSRPATRQLRGKETKPGPSTKPRKRKTEASSRRNPEPEVVEDEEVPMTMEDEESNVDEDEVHSTDEEEEAAKKQKIDKEGKAKNPLVNQSFGRRSRDMEILENATQ